MRYSWPTTSEGKVNRPDSSVTTLGAKWSDMTLFSGFRYTRRPQSSVCFAAGLPFSSSRSPVAVAVGETAMTAPGSSAPRSTIAPSEPSGLMAQT